MRVLAEEWKKSGTGCAYRTDVKKSLGGLTMRDERTLKLEYKQNKESKVVYMRDWLRQKRETTKNVLTFRREMLTTGNDHPPSVA